MARNFWKVVNEVIGMSDVVLEILDARHVFDTRNVEIERKVIEKKKILIYVINKADLVEKEDMERIKKILKPCVFVSARERLGTKKLRERILIEASREKIENPTVAVLGYPNTGKSSIINALKGRHSTGTSKEAGFTKGLQLVNIGNMRLLDSPGVIPYMEDDRIKHTKIGIINPARTKDPENLVMDIMRSNRGLIEKHYGVKEGEDLTDVLGEIALKKGLLLKGGKPDINRVSKLILKEIQKGSIFI